MCGSYTYIRRWALSLMDTAAHNRRVYSVLFVGIDPTLAEIRSVHLI